MRSKHNTQLCSTVSVSQSSKALAMLAQNLKISNIPEKTELHFNNPFNI